MSPRHRPVRPSAWRRRTLLAGWLACCAVVGVRAGQIQVAQGAEWRAMAEDQHTTDNEVAAPRGGILDRDGVPLAVSRETYRVGIAPNELEDRDQAIALLQETLELTAREARRLTSDERRWHVVPGRFPPRIREALGPVRGIHLERELQRFHPHADLARGILGTVADEDGQGGVEQAFDSLLQGTPGREVVARDNVGRPIPGETFVVDAPVSGGSVLLTLDMDLQEIARQALEEAIEESEARGGDVLVTDPRTGEILALVSIRGGQTAALSAINTPYEPGSTLKPFTVAAVLSHGVAALDDSVDVEDGTWRVARRTLHDVHGEGVMSLAEALRESSNVGVAKVAAGLTHGQQYENLRDFGFGVPTGIELPGEVGGILRRPDRWSGQSPASLAIGYEISVTPLQMAMAYGALANGGILMEPRLVKEIRDPMGTVLERFEPREVRQVVSADVAAQVASVLEDAVEDGTGTKARMATFRVAGKSGTARAYSPEGGYRAGDYYSSFVGFFPADDAQLVVFVKLERPKGGAYYGGSVAAPVTRATMEAALAARTTPLDRDRLIRSMRLPVSNQPEAGARFASRSVTAPVRDEPPPMSIDAVPGQGVALPDVAGLPARVAVRRLHALGLRVVRQSGSGDIVGTAPEAGVRVLPGDTVRLRLGRRSDG
ncbi:MAG: penicillin-binding transpeptidase domain-containing protein [Longimicrobiales bacterium]